MDQSSFTPILFRHRGAPRFIASLLVGAVLALRFKVFILVPTILAAWAVLTGIGLAWEITAAWIALEIAVVTTALQVGYLSPLLLEGLAIPPS